METILALTDFELTQKRKHNAYYAIPRQEQSLLASKLLTSSSRNTNFNLKQRFNVAINIQKQYILIKSFRLLYQVDTNGSTLYINLLL